ncbi:MAG: hypothetical protein WAV11_02875 [Minisyncoccia bacterium]
MSIKRSLLESKWYFRVMKVLFWAPPLLLIAFVAVTDWQTYYSFSQTSGNIFDIKSFYVILAAISYLIIVGIIFRIFLYIVFGGLENDIKPKVVPITQVAQSAPALDGSAAVVNYLKQAEQRKGEAVTWIILIIIFIWAAVYYSGVPSSYTTGTTGGGTKTKTSTCIPTGCGSNWQCSGSYYSSTGAQRSISGCYVDKSSVTSLNSWSGTCRQCPY